MKLARVLTVLGVAMSVGGGFALQACSSSSDGGDTSGGAGAVPPALPSGAGATTDTSVHNFALQTLYLGDTVRGQTSNSKTAWKDFGYNLDGKNSNAKSTDLCTPAAGASKATVYTDGTNGIDNSFGENIMPIILGVAANASTTINQSIADGSFTIEITLKGLSDDPKQSNSGITGYLNAGAKFDETGATKPTFTTADKWPVLNTLLTNPTDPSSSQVQFPSSYVANGTWVNGAFGGTSNDVTLAIGISGVSLSLTVHKAIITFDHTNATTADNGTIAGVINTQELVDGLQKVAGRLSTSLCGGSGFDSIAGQIKQASDILSDGTNSAGKDCDGISIGLGFTAKQISSDITAVPPGAPSPDPCSDTDAGTNPQDSGTTPADAGDGG